MEIVLIGAIVAIATCVQGSVGFGLGMLAAPLIALIAPELIPGTVLLLATTLSLSTLLRERSQVDWGAVGWASIGRAPGSLLGAGAVVLLPDAGLTVVLAGTVLLGVVLSLAGWRPPRTRGTTLLAGGASGALGTATSIGGPPMALILRGEEPGMVRATLSGTFVVGCVLSLASLGALGELRLEQVRAALVLLPFVAAGLLASGPIARRIDSARLYTGAVVVSVIGAVAAAIGGAAALLG